MILLVVATWLSYTTRRSAMHQLRFSTFILTCCCAHKNRKRPLRRTIILPLTDRMKVERTQGLAFSMSLFAIMALRRSRRCHRFCCS